MSGGGGVGGGLGGCGDRGVRGLFFGKRFARVEIVAVNFADLEAIRFLLRGGKRGVGGVERGLGRSGGLKLFSNFSTLQQALLVGFLGGLGGVGSGASRPYISIYLGAILLNTYRLP